MSAMVHCAAWQELKRECNGCCAAEGATDTSKRRRVCETPCTCSGGGSNSDTLSQSRMSDSIAHAAAVAASGTADEEQDELSYFARYLAAGLRSLPRASCLVLRHRILQLLHEAEFAELQRVVRSTKSYTHRRSVIEANEAVAYPVFDHAGEL